MSIIFEGTKEEQIERQVQHMRNQIWLDSGKRIYPDGTAFMAVWKNEEDVIQYEAVQL